MLDLEIIIYDIAVTVTTELIHVTDRAVRSRTSGEFHPRTMVWCHTNKFAKALGSGRSQSRTAVWSLLVCTSKSIEPVREAQKERDALPEAERATGSVRKAARRMHLARPSYNAQKEREIKEKILAGIT